MEKNPRSDVYQNIEAFLKLQHIAIYGVSEHEKSPANLVVQKMHEAGYQVSLLHPRMQQLGSLHCWKHINELPEKPEGVFIFTHPEHTDQIVEDCLQVKPKLIWMHNIMGTHTKAGKGIAKKMSSVSEKAVNRAREAGISVIAGSCPMQFIPPVDPFHRCLRWFNDKMNMQPESA